MTRERRYIASLTERPQGRGLGEALRQTALFEGLSDKDLEELLKSGQELRYARRAQIMTPDDKPGRIHVVLSGSARVYRLSAAGKEITLPTLPTEEVIGPHLLNPDVRWNNFAEAASANTVTYAIPPEGFREFLKGRPTVATRIMDLLSRRVADAYDLIEDLSLHDVPTRLAHLLGELASMSPDHTLRIAHDDLARMIGTRREKVTEALAQLRTLGLIQHQRHGRVIHVPDPELLLVGPEELEADGLASDRFLLPPVGSRPSSRSLPQHRFRLG